MKIGTLLKLKTKHENGEVKYHLPLGEEDIYLNDYIGKNISLNYTGKIYCIATKKKIKKSYGGGYSFESFLTLPECDRCIFKPELCHFSEGTCRDEQWGKDRCFKPHVVYLANSSSLKVGITRRTQIPTRWMDQGASFALALCEVKDRKTSGLVEIEIAKELSDKTNWRKMLKNDVDDIDLIAKKKEIVEKFKNIFEKYDAKILDDELYEFKYPALEYPTKVSSFNFDKNPLVSGKLNGIKGQYLIFDSGVINIRKFQGYEVEFKEQ
ncbi:MAG: DUF2797 domain-containing protein [Bacteriovoracaceae bacterium]|jgi:hypothetical protein|nr:DUF2797 domain-containing protein [Bacteriovoracaceae bacterium]